MCKSPRNLLHVSTDCARYYVGRRECTGPNDGFGKGEESLLAISSVGGRLFGNKRLSLCTLQAERILTLPLCLGAEACGIVKLEL